jgi:hypothetical protein
VKKPWDFEEPLCAEVGTEIFFTPDKDKPDKPYQESRYEGYKMARTICQKCPHLLECAEWGITNETYGMWGGLSPEERRKIRSRRGLTIEPRVPYVP